MAEPNYDLNRLLGILDSQDPTPDPVNPPSPTSPPSPVSLATAPTPASAPKIYEIPAERFLTFLKTRPKTPIDQGVFALEFQDLNIPASVAQELVDFCVRNKLFDTGHYVIESKVSGVQARPGDTIRIKEDGATGNLTVLPSDPPYGFTNRELLEFLKQNVGKKFDALALMNNFNISVEHAREVIGDLNATKILNAEGMLDSAILDRAEKDEDFKNMLDDEYTFVKPYTPPAPAPAPIPPPTATPAPVVPPITTAPPVTTPAPTSPPIPPAPTPAPTAAPAVLANPAAAPSNPSSFRGRVESMANTVIGWIPQPYRKTAAILAIGGAALITAGGIAALAGAKGGAPSGAPNAETQAPQPAQPAPVAAPATPAQPSASQPAPAATPASAPTTPAQATPETGTLNPSYSESPWFKQLNQDIKPTVEKILKTESAETFGAPYFKEVHAVGENRTLPLPDSSALAVYKELDRITNKNMLNTENSIRTTIVGATGQSETYNVQQGTSALRATLVNTLVQALDQGQWKYRATIQSETPSLPQFPQKNLSETYTWVRGELLKKANAEAPKK